MTRTDAGPGGAEESGRLRFADAAALEAWLAAAGVPLNSWGRVAAKTVADLWLELAAGETTLRDDPPRREVDVVEVLIRRGDTILMEIEQEMAGGRRRRRKRPPSEKLYAGESAPDAARRCLAEEVGLALAPGVLCEEEPPRDVVRDSPSYPGLLSRYRLHTVALAAGTLADSSLPDADFWRDNVAPGDVVRRHLWGWRPAERV